MSEQRSKKLKKTKSSKVAGKGNTEVFVLPPEILEKLGINLGNVEAYPEESLATSTSSDSYPIENGFVSHENKSSILETASLMKKSLLLSPTFNSEPENGPELVNNTELEKANFEHPITVDSNETLEVFNNLETVAISELSLRDSEKYLLVDVQTQEQDNQDKFLSPKQLGADISTCESTSVTMSSNLSQEVDKEFKRNAQQINNRTNFVPNSFLSNDISALNKVNSDPKKTVTSGDAQTYTYKGKLARKKRRNSVVSSKTNLRILNTPNKMETNDGISETKGNLNDPDSEEIKNERPENNDAKPTLKKFEHITKCSLKSDRSINDMESKIDSLLNLNTDEIKNNDTGTEKNFEKESERDKFYNERDTETNSNIRGSLNVEEGEKITAKKVCEMKNVVLNLKSTDESKGETLKTYTRKIKRVTGNTNSFQVQTNKQLTSEKIKFKNNIKNSVLKTVPFNRVGGQSKLYLQGVEKPGGNNATLPNINRKEKNSVSQDVSLNDESQNKFLKSKSCEEGKKYFYENIDYKQGNYDFDDETIIKSSCYKVGQFCICADFGKLNYYTSDETYEHIHFWAHENVERDPLIVFSIYKESDNHESDFVNTNFESYSEMDDGMQKSSDDTSIKIYNSSEENGDEMAMRIDVIKNYIKGKDDGMQKSSDDTSIKIYNSSEKNGDQMVMKIEDVIKNSIKGKDDGMQKSSDDTCIKMFNSSEQNGDQMVVKIEDVIKNSIKGKDDGIQKSSDDTSIKIYNSSEENGDQIVMKIEDKRTLLTADEEPAPKKSSTCDVSLQIFTGSQWEAHKDREHCKTARKEKTPPEDGMQKSSNDSSTTIYNCNQVNGQLVKKLKVIKNYIQEKEIVAEHMEKCFKNIERINVTPVSSLRPEDVGLVSETVSNNQAFQAKYGKSYGRNRTISDLQQSLVEHNKVCANTSYTQVDYVSVNTVTCGVCAEKMEASLWDAHMAKTHDYLAWKTTESPLDLNNELAVRQHLREVAKSMDGLVCNKCGITHQIRTNYMRHVHYYLLHVNKCSGVEENSEQIMLDIPSSDQILDESLTSSSDDFSGSVTCGACGQKVDSTLWPSHKATSHNYLAWQDNEKPLNLKDEDAIHRYLTDTAKLIGGLACNKCGLIRKNGKEFLQHVKSCNGANESLLDLNSPVNISRTDENKTVTCGVCSEKMEVSLWSAHMGKRHDYLAWKDTEAPLDLNNHESVQRHLTEVVKSLNGLVCNKCGIKRKFVKNYLRHVKKCIGFHENLEQNISDISSSSKMLVEDISESVTCGVCGKKVDSTLWPLHKASSHNYLAWQKNEKPLNLKDEEAIHRYLTDTAKLIGGLLCNKCGLISKHGKKFLKHVSSCNGADESLLEQNSSLNISSTDENKDGSVNLTIENVSLSIVTCGVCSEKMDVSLWAAHIGKSHDYLAWKDIDAPLDLNNDESVHQHLTEVAKSMNGFVCNKCGFKCKFVKSYLRHVKKCSGFYENSEHKISDISSSGQILDESMASKSNDVSGSVTSRDISSSGQLLDESLTSKNNKCSKSVTCGVCGKKVDSTLWPSHKASSHNYLAWQENEKALNLKDEDAIHRYLTDTAKLVGRLTCNKCGLKRKYGKMFLQHIRSCNGADESLLEESSVNISRTDENKNRSANLPIENDSLSLVTCGVCSEEMEVSLWAAHMGKSHDYLAWKDTDAPLDLSNEEALYRHLTNVAKLVGSLVCNKCGLKRKYGKLYLQHIRICNGADESLLDQDSSVNISRTDENKNKSFNLTHENYSPTIVTCGVCSEKMEVSLWAAHMGKSHDYLAWKDTDSPLDLNDESAVYKHLTDVAKIVGGLVCNKCGLTRKYGRAYMEHVKSCIRIEEKEPEPKEEAPYETTVRENLAAAASTKESVEVICGVCAENVVPKQWMTHIAQKHGYLAWKEGGTALDLNDEQIKNQYLKELCKKAGGLTCPKCGLERRYLKPYLTHVSSCIEVSGADVKLKIWDSTDPSAEVVCGVCLKKMCSSKWQTHKMEEHYNLAWAVGQAPLDFKNTYVLERTLKEYKDKYGLLVCKICKAVRGSAVGFVSHILTCGKSEEEQESYKITCEFCSKRYIYIYYNQHMKLHNNHAKVENELIKEEAEEKVKEEQNQNYETGGRYRRAAKKAIEVIAKYQSEESEYKHVCELCGYGTNNKYDLKSHDCKEADLDFSDSGESAVIEDDDESDDDDEDENDDDDNSMSVSESSDQEHTETRRKRSHHKSSKSDRMPFRREDPHEYLLRSSEQYVNDHLSEEVLYPEWQHYGDEPLSEEEVKECLPPLEESCKVRINGPNWVKINRFESQRTKELSTLFVGASIECVSWAPCSVSEGGNSRNYLAVVCRRGTDAPRLQPDQIHKGYGVIQIWDFGHFDMRPKLSLVLRHGGGYAWGARWCPAGGRCNNRLGLLAVPCSDGNAYIFSVPLPPQHESNIPYNKIKPVVELRLSRNTDRKQYQAASLDWSPEKGHKIIVVGYADGTTAYYDLTMESPLLKTKEDDVTVFYPYYDERIHNTCVTDVSVCAGVAGSGLGCTASVSPTVAALGARRGVRGAAVTARAAAHSVTFMPLWPAALLFGDETLGVGAAHELEWWGGARRAAWGFAQSACTRCPALALSRTPFVITTTLHPALDTIKRKIKCSIDMTSFAKKRRKLASDNLAVCVEPTTYGDAVNKYGLEFKWMKDGTLPMSDDNVGRFPLNEVSSLHFCQSAAHHSRLAIATHAGLIFVIDT